MSRRSRKDYYAKKRAIETQKKAEKVNIPTPVKTAPVKQEFKTETKTTKLRVATFSGIKEIMKALDTVKTKQEWGLSKHQIKELKNVSKKIRQAEKKQSKEKELSAMRAFYNAVGLRPDGTIGPETNTKMFSVSNAKKVDGVESGGGIISAKINITKTIPVIFGGSIDDIQSLANNINAVEIEMDYYHLKQRISSEMLDSEYISWIAAFIEKAKFGAIDRRLLGAIPYIVDNKDMLIKLAGWLKKHNKKLSLTGNITTNIKEFIHNKDFPNDLKTFLNGINSNLK